MSGGDPNVAAPIAPAEGPAAARTMIEQRVLLLAPTGRDAQLTCAFLASHNVRCDVFPTIGAMCDALAEGAGALIISEESIVQDGRCLIDAVSAQPVWSDVTTVILSRSGSEGTALPVVVRQLGNVSIIERPVRLSTFGSAINVALRARERQYQARDMLATYARLADSERQATAAMNATLGRERVARSDAELANRMKDEFLATLSHELRTPLSAILGWSQMLRRDNVRPETLRGGLDTIERNARAQTKIIEDLLDMSRIISGKISLDAQRSDLGQIVRAAVETVRAALVAKEIDLDVAPELLDGAIPILADPNRMQQVFWNLLSNAIKFTPRHGTIRLGLGREQSQWQVRVADSGEGINADFLPFVFDRFRQADASITRRHGGLGLGLSIVRQLVELHGGQVGVTSGGADAGSTFTVSLPVRALHQATLPTPAPRDDDAASDREGVAPADGQATFGADEGIRFDGLRVLVVDDEPDAREMVGHLLATYGATVTAAASVSDAMAAIEASPPQLIVSDIGMPGEDGYSLIARVREHPTPIIAALPAIALTAYARAEDRVRALRAGFHTHVPKPIEPSELVAVIATLSTRDAAAR